jgi:hypothetical protein
MIRVCSYCEVEGKPAVFGEKPPLEDKSRTHGACPRHAKVISDKKSSAAWFKRWAR